MKRYTQEEFDNLPVVDGRKLCPTGDYTLIKSFGERCSFGECCSFGAGCSHEGLHNSRYFAVDRIGGENRKAYFFKADEGLFVRAGCFFGTKDEFIQKLHETHGGTKHERNYLKALELAEMVLEE